MRDAYNGYENENQAVAAYINGIIDDVKSPKFGAPDKLTIDYTGPEYGHATITIAPAEATPNNFRLEIEVEYAGEDYDGTPYFGGRAAFRANTPYEGAEYIADDDMCTDEAVDLIIDLVKGEKNLIVNEEYLLGELFTLDG